MISRNRFIVLRSVAMAASVALANPAAGQYAKTGAQNYPDKPVRLIVPFTPGGSSEIVGRLIGQKLSEFWGQPVIIDNRPGAGGALGAELAARAVPDGYTLIFANPGPALHNILLRKKPLYTFSDFAPIAYVGYTSNLIAAYPKLPANNARELIAYARANPGKVNWASPGINSNPHIALEMLKAATGANIVHVPYKGAAQALTDVTTGQAHAQYASIASVEPFVKAGRLKIVGISGTKRQPALPDVATFAEQGVTGIDSTLWFGFLTAAKTPRALIERLNGSVNEALQLTDLRARLEQLGVEIEGGAPGRFSALIKSEAARLAPLIASGALQVE